MLYEYLKNHYSDGEPIFISDINIEGMTRENFCQQLKTLTDNGKLVRYEKGIYYLPRESRFHSVIGPTPETIVKYKYISRRNNISGFYSGSSFANALGISLQVPMKKEIVSNNTAAIVKEVTLGKQNFIIRKSTIPVTENNVRTLQLLELLKNFDRYSDLDYQEANKIIRNYINANDITKSGIDKYIREYPDSTFRNYYELRLDNVLA